MPLRYSEEAAQREARRPRAFLRSMKARRADTCPSCHRPIHPGDTVGVTWDRAWRCLDCATVIAALGPPLGADLLDPVERQIDARRREILMESHPITRLWGQPQGQES